MCRGLKVNRAIPAFPAAAAGFSTYICGHRRGFTALAGALGLLRVQLLF
jgi:hypothetical protein